MATHVWGREQKEFKFRFEFKFKFKFKVKQKGKTKNKKERRPPAPVGWARARGQLHCPSLSGPSSRGPKPLLVVAATGPSPTCPDDPGKRNEKKGANAAAGTRTQ